MTPLEIYCSPFSLLFIVGTNGTCDLLELAIEYKLTSSYPAGLSKVQKRAVRKRALELTASRRGNSYIFYYFPEFGWAKALRSKEAAECNAWSVFDANIL